jgi:hypothetical protein
MPPKSQWAILFVATLPTALATTLLLPTSTVALLTPGASMPEPIETPVTVDVIAPVFVCVFCNAAVALPAFSVATVMLLFTLFPNAFASTTLYETVTVLFRTGWFPPPPDKMEAKLAAPLDAAAETPAPFDCEFNTA